MATLMKKYWWKGIMNDCKEYVDKGIVCNRAKPDRRGSAPVNPLPVPAYPWEVVGVDYVILICRRAVKANILLL